MFKILFPRLLLIVLFVMGCHKPLPVHECADCGQLQEGDNMVLEECVGKNDNGYLLTVDEARMALIKEQDRIEENFRIKKKLVEEAEEAMRKWYREHGGPLPDSISDVLYEPFDVLWDRVREQREIYEKYNTNFEVFFQEFVEIEYETTPPWDENKKYIYQWECDLKEGLFRTIASEESPDWVSYGRFIKDEAGEWTAIYVRHDGTVEPHGYPRGGIPDGDRSPFGD